MIRGIRCRRAKLAILQNDKHLIVSMKFAQIFSSSIIIQAENISIEPNLASTQCRSAPFLQRNTMTLIFSKNISHRLTALNGYFTEIAVDKQSFHARLRDKSHPQNLGFSIGIRCKPNDPRPRFTLRKIIFLIPSHTGHSKTFHIMQSCLSVPINRIVYRTFIILLKYGNM